MRITARANNWIEHRLQVPMAKAITLPLTIDGEKAPSIYSVYLSTSGWDPRQPSDQDVVKIARIIADRINKGNAEEGDR